MFYDCVEHGQQLSHACDQRHFLRHACHDESRLTKRLQLRVMAAAGFSPYFPNKAVRNDEFGLRIDQLMIYKWNNVVHRNLICQAGAPTAADTKVNHGSRTYS